MSKCFVYKTYKTEFAGYGNLSGKNAVITDIINDAGGFVNLEQDDMEISREMLSEIEIDIKANPEKWKKNYKLNEEDFKELVFCLSKWQTESDQDNDFIKLTWV